MRLRRVSQRQMSMMRAAISVTSWLGGWMVQLRRSSGRRGRVTTHCGLKKMMAGTGGEANMPTRWVGRLDPLKLGSVTLRPVAYDQKRVASSARQEDYSPSQTLS